MSDYCECGHPNAAHMRVRLEDTFTCDMCWQHEDVHCSVNTEQPNVAAPVTPPTDTTAHRFARPDVPDHASVNEGEDHVGQPTPSTGDGNGPRGERSTGRRSGGPDGDGLRGVPGGTGVAAAAPVVATGDRGTPPTDTTEADPLSGFVDETCDKHPDEPRLTYEVGDDPKPPCLYCERDRFEQALRRCERLNRVAVADTVDVEAEVRRLAAQVEAVLALCNHAEGVRGLQVGLTMVSVAAVRGALLAATAEGES